MVVKLAAQAGSKFHSLRYELNATALISHYSSSIRFFVRVSHITFLAQMHKNSFFLVLVKCVRKNY